jgi:hypothetical protein
MIEAFRSIPWYVHHTVGPWWASLLFLAAVAGLIIAQKVMGK